MGIHSYLPLLAYFDPGSGSLLLQAFVGGTAGIFVLAKYLWSAVPFLFHARKSARDSIDAV